MSRSKSAKRTEEPEPHPDDIEKSFQTAYGHDDLLGKINPARLSFQKHKSHEPGQEIKSENREPDFLKELGFDLKP